MNTATESTEPNGIASAIWSVAIVGALFTFAAPTLLGSGSRLSVEEVHGLSLCAGYDSAGSGTKSTPASARCSAVIAAGASVSGS